VYNGSNRNKRGSGYRLYRGEQGRDCPAEGRAAWQRSRDCRGVVAWDTPNSAQLGCGTHLTLRLTNQVCDYTLTGLAFVMGHFTGRSEAHACGCSTIFVMRCCATFENSLVHIEGASRERHEKRLGQYKYVHFRAASSQPSISDTKSRSKRSLPWCTGDTRSTSYYADSVWLSCSEHSRL